jgi:lysophospholipase L1-like esterase
MSGGFGSFVARGLVISGTTPPLTLLGTSTASASAGPFSASNYFTGSADPEMSAGTSVAIMWWSDDYTADERLVSNAGTTLNKSGWYFRLWEGSGVLGGQYGVTRFALMGGTGGIGSENTFNGQRYRLGLNCTVITHTAGGNIRQSTNGSPVESIGSGTYVATDAFAVHYVGKAQTGSAAAAHKLIEVAYFNDDLSDADMLAISKSVNEYDAFRLNDTARLHANLVWSNHFGDDWDGGATCASGRGSGANTYTKTGTIAQNAIDAEDVYSFPLAMLRNTLEPTQLADYIEHDSWASLRLSTDAEAVRVRVHQTASWLNRYAVGVDVDGAYSGRGDITEAPGTTTTVDVTDLGSGLKTIEVFVGLHTAGRTGAFFVGEFSVPTGSHVAGVVVTRPPNRCVIVGDSISVGENAIVVTEKAWSLQLRRSLGADWGITNDGHGSRAVAIEAADLNGMGDSIVARLDGTSRNVVLWELGTVDWGPGYESSKATYKSQVTTVLDRIHTVRPDAEVIALTAVPRSGEATPNAGGAILQDFRDALNEIAATRGSWMTVIDGPSLVSIGTGIDADGIHLNNVGSDALAAGIETALLA